MNDDSGIALTNANLQKAKIRRQSLVDSVCKYDGVAIGEVLAACWAAKSPQPVQDMIASFGLKNVSEPNYQ